MGLVSGAFVLYAHAIMPGLKKTDDRTIAVHVPLNDALKAATDPNLAAVRDRFNEARWAGWNIVRAVTSTAAFACLAWALVVYGRSTHW
jgi:uncharacterized membrane protein